MKARLALGVLLCTVPVFATQLGPRNIFKNDSQTRTPANDDQIRWTVNVGGCSGSMLDRKHLLTANHCSPRPGAVYTSGGCLALKCSKDLQAVSVVEKDSNLDYAIVEVKWLRQDSMRAQRYTPLIQTKADDVVAGKDGEGTKLFTVGFPGDKSGVAMHAVGYAKKVETQSLLYNVGSINGNSGGAVWRFDDFMLVTQTNFGPQALGQPGWKDRDPEDAKAWNGGSRMDVIYAKSAKMKDLFPQGRNPEVDSNGYLRPIGEDLD